MKKTVFLFIGLIVFAILGYALIEYYPYIFSKKVQGEVIGVERITQPGTVITQGSPPDSTQMFSFAIAIQDRKTGEIVTGSSEDRQWAVVQKGQCAVAQFYPYPFWKLDKAGTYFGTRLMQLFECSKMSQ